ncbi:hypothetical protein N7495_009368 [Penicillium taxi]|uniref:uncharacterized protein n=1 Tax=Penicillium taxi TaxID=168475 RepID=UPI0025456DA2|nr:uncharacterized protein N7495_009368 [Penicillium taxi]KAJ5884858.1 hypothetical protein N7495_009368 [Penicillium taxi]
MCNRNFSPNQIPNLAGKVIFITGGTNGLGAQSALQLARHDAAHIYISGRNEKGAEKVIEQIKETGTKTEVSFIKCDLASLSSVKEAAERFISQVPRLDILMCNAGIMATPPGLTSDGYEVQFGTNYVGHALLIKKFLPLLQKTAKEVGDVRILLLTSEALKMHPRGGIIFSDLKTVQSFAVGGSWQRYGQSKLAVALYARELARRYPSILSVSIHPGIVGTDLVGNCGVFNRVFLYMLAGGKLLAPEHGAYTQIWAATVPREDIENGHWYEPVGKLADHKLGGNKKNDVLSERLWNWTKEELERY